MTIDYSNVISNGDDRLHWCITDISWIIANCTWRCHPWLPQRSRADAAVALQTYHLAQCCLTRETVHSDVTTAGNVLQRSGTQANWRGTCKWSTGAVPARTSTLNTATCVVKCFRSRSVCWRYTCVGVPNTSTTSWLTGQAVTTRTVAVTRLHLPHTVHFVSVYAPSLPGSATRFPRRLHAGHTTSMSSLI